MNREDAIRLREAMCTTQSDLAELLGMTTRAWQAIEAGDAKLRRVHILALERIAIYKMPLIGSTFGLDDLARQITAAATFIETGKPS